MVILASEPFERMLPAIERGRMEWVVRIISEIPGRVHQIRGENYERMETGGGVTGLTELNFENGTFSSKISTAHAIYGDSNYNTVMQSPNFYTWADLQIRIHIFKAMQSDTKEHFNAVIIWLQVNDTDCRSKSK